jgi:hypothetical protein
VAAATAVTGIAVGVRADPGRPAEPLSSYRASTGSATTGGSARTNVTAGAAVGVVAAGHRASAARTLGRPRGTARDAAPVGADRRGPRTGPIARAAVGAVGRDAVSIAVEETRRANTRPGGSATAGCIGVGADAVAGATRIPGAGHVPCAHRISRASDVSGARRARQTTSPPEPAGAAKRSCADCGVPRPASARRVPSHPASSCRRESFAPRPRSRRTCRSACPGDPSLRASRTTESPRRATHSCICRSRSWTPSRECQGELNGTESY